MCYLTNLRNHFTVYTYIKVLHFIPERYTSFICQSFFNTAVNNHSHRYNNPKGGGVELGTAGQEVLTVNSGHEEIMQEKPHTGCVGGC